MFDRLEVARYKCLQRVEVTFRPFNILVGPNASGNLSTRQSALRSSWRWLALRICWFVVKLPPVRRTLSTAQRIRHCETGNMRCRWKPCSPQVCWDTRLKITYQH